VTAHARKRLGRALIVLGLVTIVVAVLVVLETANGPGTGPKAFAERRSYDQVKVEVHRTFPYALVAGVLGLGLALAGARLARVHGDGPPAA
jgi:ABC-type Fe3+ transport system permease subunit